MSDNELYYFGCNRQSGHFLHVSEHGHVMSCRYTSDDFQQRFGRNGERLDGTYCPPGAWGTQLYIESKVGPWFIISWNDCSVDSRPGSHSTFVGRGYSSHTEMLLDACVRFKPVFDRQPPVKSGMPQTETLVSLQKVERIICDYQVTTPGMGQLDGEARKGLIENIRKLCG